MLGLHSNAPSLLMRYCWNTALDSYLCLPDLYQYYPFGQWYNTLSLQNFTTTMKTFNSASQTNSLTYSTMPTKSMYVETTCHHSPRTQEVERRQRASGSHPGTPGTPPDVCMRVVLFVAVSHSSSLQHFSKPDHGFGLPVSCVMRRQEHSVKYLFRQWTYSWLKGIAQFTIHRHRKSLCISDSKNRWIQAQ